MGGYILFQSSFICTMSDDTPQFDDTGSTDGRVTDPGPTITRRRYVGALGVSGFGLTELGSLLRSGDDTVKIVVEKLGDRPLRTEEVPARWYRQAKRAERVADTLKQTLLPEPDVTSVGVGRDDRFIGDLRTKAVSVGTRPGGADVTIPDEIEGVPVVEDREETFEFTHCYANDYDPVIGGVAVEHDTLRGSTCCRCYRNGSYYMLTVRHLVSSGTCDDSISGEAGSEITQNLDYFGTVKDVYIEHDSALVKRDSSGSRSGISPDIVDDTVEIAGRFTKDGLCMLQSDGTYIDRRGVGSCTDTNQVHDYDKSIWCDDTNVVLADLVYLTGTSESGDSGGPVYDPRNSDEASLANMVSGNTSNGYIFGAAAYAMHNQQNLYFT